MDVCFYRWIWQCAKALRKELQDAGYRIVWHRISAAQGIVLIDARLKDALELVICTRRVVPEAILICLSPGEIRATLAQELRAAGAHCIIQDYGCRLDWALAAIKKTVQNSRKTGSFAFFVIKFLNNAAL